jgi:hypothetical protein
MDTEAIHRMNQDDPSGRISLFESNNSSSNLLLCYFDKDAFALRNSSCLWKDHPMQDLIRFCRPLCKLSVIDSPGNIVYDVSPMVVVVSENSTYQDLKHWLSWCFGCSTDALEQLHFDPDHKTILLDQSPKDSQGRLHAVEQIIEICPLMNKVCFVQCDFTPQIWMSIFAGLCKVQAPEVDLGLIDCQFDDEAANQLKTFLHVCPQSVYLHINQPQHLFPPCQSFRLLPLLGPSVHCLQILLICWCRNRKRILYLGDRDQRIIEESVNFLGRSTNNLAVRELRFAISPVHVRGFYDRIISRIPSLYGIESLVIANGTHDNLGNHWRAFERTKKSLLRALDINCSVQKFELTAAPWSDDEITFLESVLHRNACISSWIASSPAEIPCFGLWPHVLFRIMQKSSPIQTTIIYEALRTLC